MPAHDIAVEPGDAASLLQFDPRQGTLLGFELPADALASMTEDLAPAQVESIAQPGAIRAARGRPASAEQTGAGALPDTAGTVGVIEDFTAVAEPTPAAEAARAFPVPPFAIAASADSVAKDKPSMLNTAESAELAEAVASLQAALFEERRAADERWRRTRHWLALASAGLVVLLALFVAQTIALLSFSHRTRAAQQQTLSTLSDQQAALSALASSTSALSERMQPPREQADPAGDGASAPNPQRQAKHTHARHPKDKAKPTAVQ